MVYKLGIDIIKRYIILLEIKTITLFKWYIIMICNDFMHIGNCINNYWIANHEGKNLRWTRGSVLCTAHVDLKGNTLTLIFALHNLFNECGRAASSWPPWLCQNSCLELALWNGTVSLFWWVYEVDSQCFKVSITWFEWSILFSSRIRGLS